MQPENSVIVRIFLPRPYKIPCIFECRYGPFEVLEEG